MKPLEHDLQKIVIAVVAFLLIAILLCIKAQAVERWTMRQERAHEIAELARSMGMPEDDPIIIRASEIWWQDDAKAYITDWPPDLLRNGGLE